jgi:hypothetical protein
MSHVQTQSAFLGTENILIPFTHDAAEQDPLAGEEALAITCEIPAKISTSKYKASMFKLKMHFSKERKEKECKKFQTFIRLA